MNENEKGRVAAVAKGLVSGLDGIQSEIGNFDGIDPQTTTLVQIKDTPLNKLWIWPSSRDSQWFLVRMQKLANANAGTAGKAKTLFPGAFADCKTPLEIFLVVLGACDLNTWYADLSKADKEALLA
jgi:hypothetical protein